MIKVWKKRMGYLAGFIGLVLIVNACQPQNIVPVNESYRGEIPPPKDSLTNNDDLITQQNKDTGELNGEVFMVVEKMPEFPGGDTGWMQFISDHVHYPQIAKEQGIQGKVWISFVVDKFGYVRQAEIDKGIGGGCDEEALRVIQLSPRWKPGQQGGKNVNVEYRMPINFVLN